MNISLITHLIFQQLALSAHSHMYMLLLSLSQLRGRYQLRHEVQTLSNINKHNV